MGQFQVETNALKLKNFLSQVARQQIPFAASKTINDMAYDIKREEQGKLDQYFEMRTDWLRKSGAMPVVKSNKRQFPDIFAVLGVKDEIAAMNATGGEKRARGKAMAVPITGITRGHLNPGRLTLSPSNWPKKILRKKLKSGKYSTSTKRTAFVLESKGKSTVFTRIGGELKPLYVFRQRIKVDDNWPVQENAERYVARNYDRVFDKNLSAAIRTARY